MNILARHRTVVVAVLALIVSTQCYPAKTKKGKTNHRQTIGHHRGHGKSSAKKDSVNQRMVMAAVMQPGKLDMSEQRDLAQFQDYNKAYINNEMAAETSILANQGIDDDSALKISNMAALPGELDRGSKKGIRARYKGSPVPFNKPSTAGYSPDEYLLDANSWPEYRIKDSDYSSRNYRIFPGGGYQGGFTNNAMQYGQRIAAGMEGPYGDGNYGFAPQQQMVSDEQNQDQEGGPSPPPQDDGSPMTMSPATLSMKHNRKMSNAQNLNYGDQASMGDTNTTSDGSGSGHDTSGSGSISHDSKAVTLVPEPGKMVTTAGGEGSGQVTIDTKQDGTITAEKTPVDGKQDSSTFPGQVSEGKQDSAASGPPGKPEPQGNMGPKTQENTLPGQAHVQKSTDKETTNGGSIFDGKPTTDQARPSLQKGQADINNESTHSTLGEFAKFLKSKGITLTINKDAKDAKDALLPSQVKDHPTSSQSHSSPSSTSAILPSTGQTTSSSNGNHITLDLNPTNAAEGEQGHHLHNAVMHWQNVSPQGGPVGELFLRHKTKQQH